MRNSGLTCGTGGLRAEQGAQPYTRPTTSHANPLFRTRAISSAREPAIPSLGNPAHMRNSGLTCGTGGLRAEQGAQPYTRPTTSHANPLFRTRAISSAREPAIPSLGNPAHMRNSGLTCGTGGLRAEQGAQPYTRPTTSHANPLFRTRAISSAREPAIPSLGNTAHMRNSGLTCGTAGLRAEQRVNMRNRGFTCGTATGGPAWGRPSCMPARRSRALWALCVSDAGRQRSLRGSCPWRGRRGLPRVPRRRYPRASRPKR